MVPAFFDGDFVVCLNRKLREAKQGDVVALNHPYYGTIIKRIEKILENESQMLLSGDNKEASTSSKDLGRPPLGCCFGKVIWHIRTPT